jgi:hypothetical protein
VGDGEKLLTYLNSALKVLSGLDIFPRETKKKLNFVDQCNLFNDSRYSLDVLELGEFNGLKIGSTDNNMKRDRWDVTGHI